MCDFGLVLGLAAGVAQTVGQMQAAQANQNMARQQAVIDNTAHQREFLVENNAALKDAAQASLEGDRAKSLAVASSSGMTGATPGLRAAEQSRQTALSIANAKDRSQAARANYSLQTHSTAVRANNQIASHQVSPFAAFANIATAGLQNYGAFA